MAGGWQLRRVFRPARRAQEAGAAGGREPGSERCALSVGADAALGQRVQSVRGQPAGGGAQRVRGGQGCSVQPSRGVLRQTGHPSHQHHDQTQR